MDNDMNVAAESQPIAEPVVNNEPAPAATEPVQSEPAPAVDNTPSDEPATEPKEKYVLYTDENGNKELKIVRDKESAEPESQADEPTEPAQSDDSVTQQADNVVDQMNTPAAQYNLNEFLDALKANTVDEARIPNEYMAQYANYKIQQVMEAQNQQVEAEKQQREQINQQLTPEKEQENMKTFLQNLDVEAGNRAAKDVGLTEDDIANLDFMDDGDEKLVNYKLAKEWRRNQLMASLQQRANEEMMARQKQAQIYKDIQDFTAKAKVTEPNFDAIDKMMSERYKTLPYAEGKRVEEVLQALSKGTITEAQTIELKNYYDATRKEYYAKKNGLSTKPKRVPRPPVVERAGNGKEIEKNYTPDYAALRNGDPKQQVAWLAEYLRNKGR